jgi:hypothetical protein
MLAPVAGVDRMRVRVDPADRELGDIGQWNLRRLRTEYRLIGAAAFSAEGPVFLRLKSRDRRLYGHHGSPAGLERLASISGLGAGLPISPFSPGTGSPARSRVLACTFVPRFERSGAACSETERTARSKMSRSDGLIGGCYAPSRTRWHGLGLPRDADHHSGVNGLSDPKSIPSLTHDPEA